MHTLHVITRFTRAYQVRHGNALEYDFLHGLAAHLECIAESMGVIPVREPLPPQTATSPCAPGRPDRTVLRRF